MEKEKFTKAIGETWFPEFRNKIQDFIDENGEFPDDLINEMIYSLSLPEKNTLPERAYQKMEEFMNSCNLENCEQDFLDDIEFFAWYKIYNEWDFDELKEFLTEKFFKN